MVNCRSSSWNLTLNPDKCVVMRFGADVAAEGGSGYYLNGVELELVKTHRDLGVIVDNTLKFHGHVNSVVGKAAGLANQLLRATVCREESFMVTLFVSHIRPLLDYCSTVWNLGYVGDLQKLERVQRRWTKEIHGLGEVSYGERLRRLGLYSIKGRLFRADLVKTWKAFHSKVDVGLSQVFERVSHPSTRGHQFKLSIPVCRSEIRRRFFSVRVVNSWNNLPPEVVSTDSLESFKSYLDRLLSDKFYDVAD